ncbi:MAG: SpoIIIAH-like family protein [Clostridiales bacterium]|nr:SpoIIIAH-like family protein [Clostridiales bacterium]
MKITAKKRQVMLAALVVFLGIAVFVNWYYTTPDDKISAADSVSEENSENVVNLGDAIYADATDEYSDEEYFAAAKLSRDESYDEAVATLNEIIESGDADGQSVQTAAQSLNELSENRIAQVNIENLVTAKTGSECVAVISGNSADIIVSGRVINSDVVLQIKEIVMDNTDIEAENISVIEAK